MKLLTSIAACLLLMTNAHAATVVIDFEDVVFGAVAPTSRGFNFSTGITIGSYDQNRVLETCYDLATCYYDPGYPGASPGFDFSKQDSTVFDLISFQISTQGCLCSPRAGITGYFADGSSIQQDLILYGEGGFLQQITLGAGWTNLKSVSIYGTQELALTLGGPIEMQLDNIIVSTVPIPSAVWLFASGLGLLGWLRRQHAGN